ncbi:uncharacterized protein LOC112554214 [Pomacea canaliculata]|uniref:uncharacterized protein LOC112554214 n=1 Tax=Pomacea canaliculata TaxID=400727 RepID=UPI000D735786|nr:uncharacterized protein LOC112554214 [Pomacea canaliculata]
MLRIVLNVFLYNKGFHGALWASQFLSAVIASERCFCVVSPFHAKRLLKTSTMAAIIVVCCVLLIGGMCTIVVSKHKSACVFDPSTKVTEQAEYITEFYQKNKGIIDIFDIFIYSTGLSGIFLVVIIISTCITAVKLRAALSWRLTTASETTTSATATTSTDRKMKSKEVNLTLMLMATSVWFTVCMAANFLIQICRLTVPGFNYGGEYFLLISPLFRIIYLLWAVNTSMNFVLYYKMGSKFRDTMNELLRLKCIYAH